MRETSLRILKLWNLWILLGGYIALVIYTVHNRKAFTYDEPEYLQNVARIERYGISKVFLQQYHGTAGPTYALVHYFLRGITQLHVPYVRLVNCVLILFSIVLLWILIEDLIGKGKGWLSFNVFAIPMTYVCSGMALTEVPALFFLMTSLFTFWFVLPRVPSNLYLARLFISFAAGLLFSLCVLGRQVYLPLLLPLALFCSRKEKAFSYQKKEVAAFIVGALILVIPVFAVWHGLLPLPDRYAENGVSPYHFFLALSCTALIAALIAPRLLQTVPWSRLKTMWLMLILLIPLYLSVFKNYRVIPLRTAAQHWLSPTPLLYYSALASAAFVTFGIYFLYCLYFHWRLNPNPLFQFSLFSIFLITLSTLKITYLFSSRYVFQLAPFLVFLSAKYDPLDHSKVLRSLVGICFGMLSLTSYFW